MLIYRPKRFLLEDAMKEAKCFNTLDELKQYVVECNLWDGKKTFDVEDLVLGESTNGDDDRNGWRNNRYIYTKKQGRTDYVQKYGCVQCIGFVGEVDDNYIPENWRAWRYWHRKYLYEQFYNNPTKMKETKLSNEIVSPDEEVKFYCKCGHDFKAEGNSLTNCDKLGDTEFYYIKCPRCGDVCISDSSYIVKEYA